MCALSKSRWRSKARGVCCYSVTIAIFQILNLVKITYGFFSDYKSWCHVSCALWTPEVSIQDVELMEPITNIGGIPQARKNLHCVLCKKHYGAPIQCSVMKCKVAFHVTCAFLHNMAMLQELCAGDVRLLVSFYQFPIFGNKYAGVVFYIGH